MQSRLSKALCLTTWGMILVVVVFAGLAFYRRHQLAVAVTVVAPRMTQPEVAETLGSPTAVLADGAVWSYESPARHFGCQYPWVLVYFEPDGRVKKIHIHH